MRVDRSVDVIVTHDGKFMFERDEVCGLLQDKGLTHIWAHLPLEQTLESTLLTKIGCHHV